MDAQLVEALGEKIALAGLGISIMIAAMLVPLMYIAKALKKIADKK